MDESKALIAKDPRQRQQDGIEFHEYWKYNFGACREDVT
jgi:hypothetical protein